MMMHLVGHFDGPPTTEQNDAAEYLARVFGSASVEPTMLYARNRRVKVCGIDGSGCVRARWHVCPRGTITSAYDPENARKGYRPAGVPG